jgi:hypothetical protein
VLRRAQAPMTVREIAAALIADSDWRGRASSMAFGAVGRGRQLKAALRNDHVRWKNHQRDRPRAAHIARLNTMARIHGIGDEKRITSLGLTISVGKCGDE